MRPKHDLPCHAVPSIISVNVQNAHEGHKAMARTAVAGILFAVILGGCGTLQADRTLSGAAVGAGVGVVVGPIGSGVGAVVGAVVGAGVGYVTDKDDVYLGRPIWRHRRHAPRRH